jgi:hypothetical protein
MRSKIVEPETWNFKQVDEVARANKDFQYQTRKAQRERLVGLAGTVTFTR